MNYRSYIPPRILIVDDEKTIALTLGQILDIEGYEAAVCLGAEAAMERAPRFYPDLLVSDIDLAGTNGADLAVRISTMLPYCRVLLISGHTSIDRWIDALVERPNFSLIAKPFPVPEFLKAIACMLSEQPCRESRYSDSFCQNRFECPHGHTGERGESRQRLSNVLIGFPAA